MVPLAPTSRTSSLLTNDDNVVGTGDVNRPVVNRRQLLVRVGSWMKYSWRKSKDSLMDSVDEEDEEEEDEQIRNNSCSDDENIEKKVPKHVHFGDDQDSVVIETLQAENDVSEEDAKEIWFQHYDYKRFEKDCVLTTMDYTNSRNLNRAFTEVDHSVRGIEHLCDASLHQRHMDERKDLYKALKVEEARQKEDGSFPDLDEFRAVSLKYTMESLERAYSKACEDAREQQLELRRSSSMKNLFRRAGRSTSRPRQRRQSFG